MPRPIVRSLLVLVLLPGLLVGCVAGTSAQGGGGRSAPAASSPGAPVAWKESGAGGPAPELARFNDLLADLAERLKPSLVHIRSQRAGGKNDDDIEAHRELRRSSGSGFVIDERGLIVTNAHVVEDADSVQARLSDGRRFNAKVIGQDTRVDLALLKIDGATGLTALPLADSNRLRVGEFVLAFGHPFGLDQSVSFGIVSRKGAPLTVAAPGFDFIQTDAAINPGNSGGPLVNMAGAVVGVNSMAARNGSIGFAIPANLVKMLVPQLATKGRVEWGWLGVSIAEITDEEAGRLGLREAKGVLIRSVMPGEPADKGGVKANDVILAAGDTRLDTPRDLQRVVSSTPVGSLLRLKLLRAGHEQELEVTVGLYKEPKEAESPK
jgi:serine protease Do